MNRLPQFAGVAGGQNIITTPPLLAIAGKGQVKTAAEKATAAGCTPCDYGQNEKFHVVKKKVLTNGKLCAIIFSVRQGKRAHNTATPKNQTDRKGR